MAGMLLLGQPAAAPTGKKGQVNLNGLAAEYDFPFINMAPFFTVFQARSNAPTEDVYPFINADGYPTGFPSGSGLFSANGSLYYPGGYATFTGSISGTTLTVSSAVTGDALAIGRTVRGAGVTAGTRIISGSGASWQVSQSMSATGSITITASIPWVIDWAGSADVTLGFNQNIITYTTVNISANRKEIHMAPYAGSTIVGDISVNTLTVSSVTGSPIPATGGLTVSGIGMPPFSSLDDFNGGGGPGIYFIVGIAGGLRTISYTTSGQTYTIPATPVGAKVVAAINVTNIVTTPSNIRVYRQDQEALLNAGQLCAPHFIAYYGQYGRIRFLNWLQTNGNMQGQWIQRAGVTNFSWVQNNVIPLLYGGMATNVTKNDYSSSGAISYTDSSGVVQSNPSSWTDGMMLQTQVSTLPTLKVVTGLVWTGSATKVTATAHGFSTGDVVFFPPGEISGGNWEGNLNFGAGNGLLGKCIYTITVLNVNEFTLDGINSSTWGTYSSGGHVGWQVRFKSGNLPYKTIINQDIMQNPLTTQLAAMIPIANQSLQTLVYSASLDVLLLQSIPNQTRGVPIEIACQVCNECSADSWLSVPMYATDNFVEQMSTTIKANLNHAAGLKWCAELSNEVWNNVSGFAQTEYARYKSMSLFPGVFVDSTQAMYEYYGYRFYQMTGVINGVYSGADAAKCIRIFAFKTDDGVAAPAFNNYRLQAPSTGIPAYPMTLADELCCATYLGPDFANQSDAAKAIGNYQQGVLTSNAALVTSALDDTDAMFNTYLSYITPYWTYYRDLAATHGVNLSAYEGGFSPLPGFWWGGSFKPISPMSYLGIPFNSLDQLNLWTAYQLSDQYGATYPSFMNLWTSLSGTYFSQYQSTGLQPDPLSMWTMRYPSIFGATNPGEIAFNAYNAG